MKFPKIWPRKESTDGPCESTPEIDEVSKARETGRKFAARLKEKVKEAPEYSEQGDSIVDDYAATVQSIQQANIPAIILEGDTFTWKQEKPTAPGHVKTQPRLTILAKRNDGTLIQKQLGWVWHPKDYPEGGSSEENVGVWVGFNTDWEEYNGDINPAKIPALSSVYLQGMHERDQGFRVSALIEKYQAALNMDK